MKFAVAIVLVVISLVAAEPPRPRAKVDEAPYQARGWRPAGPTFSLPARLQQQQPPVPAPSYGPPPQEYGPPEATTTEQPTTTETVTEETVTDQPPQRENLKLDPRTSKPEAAKLQQDPGQLYVVLPQGQNVFYAVPQTSQLVAVQRANLVAAPTDTRTAEEQKPNVVPVQAVPAFAKLQEVPQVARLQLVPAIQSATTTSIFTPYSSSFVQIYQ